jgi:uncharacterized protein (TIGR03546 family)
MANRVKRPVYERLKRKAKLAYLKLLRLDDPPERIALGAAIGVLMGILPTFGVGGVLSVILAFIFKANKAAAVLGSIIMNPLTSPFFWTLSAIIGSFILGENSQAMLNALSSTNTENIIGNLSRVTLVYMTGNVIISALFTVSSYFIVKVWVIKHREKKALRRKMNEQQNGTLR